MIIALGFAGCVYMVVFEWNNPNKSARNWSAIFAVMCLALLLLSIKCTALLHDNKIRDQWFMNHKPTCAEDTIECLTEKAEWYDDSVRYKVNRYPTEQDRIDALKDYVKYYEK